MTDILTTNIYKYTTVFVDHFSRYSYMQLQKTISAEETLEGKHFFERMSESHGIIIKQYHVDNGIFRANAWVQDSQEPANTQLTNYAGVDAYHNNGLSKRLIRYIQDNGRSMMLHSQWKCP